MSPFWLSSLRKFAVAAAITICSVSNAKSGPFEDAEAARDRGDRETAFRIYRALVDQGNAKAEYYLGGMYYGDGDFGQALKWYQKAAEDGFAQAEYRIGEMYIFGHGVRKDADEGVRHYKKALLAGYAPAGWELGRIYYLGEDVERDYAQSAKWFRLSAEQGYAISAHQLALLYRDGEGVPKDFVSAHMWSNLAAAWAKPEATILKAAATALRDSLEGSMTPGQIAEARRLAREFKPKQ